MAINLIDKIVAKNNAFTGLVDAEQIIGDGATNVLPDAVVSVSNVTQHEISIDHENLLNAGIDIRNEGLAIYVDPAGSDDASGDIGHPVQTIWGAIQKIPVQGLTYVYLAAGTYTLPNWTADVNYYKNTIIQSEGRVAVIGTVTTLESFTVLSCVNNIVTATPDPGWTINEHRGKCLRWGTSSHYWIISNTSDALTVAITTSDIGGSNAKPTGTVNICELSSIIAPGTSNNYSSYLYATGRTIFWDIHFNGSAGGSAGRIGLNGIGGNELTVKECKFSNWSWYGIVGAYYIAVTKTMFDNCAIGIAPGYGATINGNNFFYNKLTGVAIESRYTNSLVTLNHDCAAWMHDIGTYLRIGNNTMVDDSSFRVWASGTCQTYANLWALAIYKNSGHGLIGMPGALTFTVQVFYFKEEHNKLVLYDSTTSTLQPDASYFKSDTYTLSLTDYIAEGSSVEFDDGNTAIG